jgi:putative membrane protein
MLTIQERLYGWEWSMHPMWGFWGAWSLVMFAIMLLFWAVVIIGLVLGIRRLLRLGEAPHTDAALDILRQRYARGEIGKEEFESKKRDLTS